MATRGCTSSAASNDPQVRRVPWTRMRRMPAFAQRRSKARPEKRAADLREEGRDPRREQCETWLLAKCREEHNHPVLVRVLFSGGLMRINLGDVRLWFDVSGPSVFPESDTTVDRPTIVAVHGGPGVDHINMKAKLAPLAEHVQVVYYDQRGHGRSDHSTSFGGFVVLTYAGLFPGHPGGIIIRAAPALPGATRIRLPSATPPCCDRAETKVSHLHSNDSASRRKPDT
jgi:hypothetical protein